MKTMSGKKFDGGKLRLDLVPVEFIEEMARVFEYGAKKYGVDNWRQGFDLDRLYAAALRHLFAWRKGGVADEESGLPHLAQAAWNMLVMLHYENEVPCKKSPAPYYKGEDMIGDDGFGTSEHAEKTNKEAKQAPQDEPGSRSLHRRGVWRSSRCAACILTWFTLNRGRS